VLDVSPISCPTSTTCGAAAEPRQLPARRDKTPCSAHTKAFPRNTEPSVAHVHQRSAGFAIRTHAPDGRFVTLRQHLAGALPTRASSRKFDPRIGLEVSFYEFSRKPSSNQN